MKGKNKKIITLLFVAILYGCTEKPLVYKIRNEYRGPCVLFVKGHDNSNSIIIDNGLGKISQEQLKEKFIISTSRGEEIDIIPIGSENSARDSIVYVFCLLNGKQSSNCSNSDLHIVHFFVGYKNNYLKWSEEFHNNELAYFDSIGLNWCSYYQKIKW